MHSNRVDKVGTLLLDCGGGLGNQLFEYAAGLYLAAQWNMHLKVVRPISAHAQWNGFARPFQLTEFKITSPVMEATLLDRAFFSNNPKVKRLLPLLQTLLRAKLVREGRPYHYDPEIGAETTASRMYVAGNWQAASYVAWAEAQLRREFVLRNELSEINQRYADKIQSQVMPVSIHFRVGDYALIRTSAESSMVLGMKYYQTALEQLDAEFPEATLVVFSDDAEKARAMLAHRKGVLFVEGNGPQTAYQDMHLMSLCRHHVIANSSFSWWGAWLNPSSHKRVWAPTFWGNTRSSYFPDLFPDLWTKIDNLEVD
jgi:hypothetical protein